MFCNLSKNARRPNARRLALLAMAVLWAATCEAVQAQSVPLGVARVEEDWALVVNAPDDNDNGPQVTCVMAPLNLDNGYLALDVNFHTQPDYSPGGIQMHFWSPNTPMLVADSGLNGMLKNQTETITWTTRMTLKPGGALTFDVVKGHSQTWGEFGEDGKLSLTLSTSLEDLSTYSPEVSLENSGVPYASNRVTSLTLVAVRWYSASGTLLLQNTTPQLVHPQN